jgi:ParB-like chromosome segregation protein Spo0J
MLLQSRPEKIDPNLIVGEGYGGRKFPRPEKEQEAFERDIANRGVMSAIGVCDIEGSNEKELTYGKRRRDSSKKAKASGHLVSCGVVKVDVYPASTSKADKIAMAIVENQQRGDLRPVEIGEAVQSLYEELDKDSKAVAIRLNVDEQVVKDWLDAVPTFGLNFAEEVEQKDIPALALMKRKIPASRWEDAWKAIRLLDRGQAKKVIREMARNTISSTDKIVDNVAQGRFGTSIYVPINDGALHKAIKQAALADDKTKAEYLLALAKEDTIKRGLYTNGKAKVAEEATAPQPQPQPASTTS